MTIADLYPRLFAHCERFDVRPGWRSIVLALCARLEGAPVSFREFDASAGRLRVFVLCADALPEGEAESIWGWIAYAELASMRVCASCGTIAGVRLAAELACRLMTSVSRAPRLCGACITELERLPNE